MLCLLGTSQKNFYLTSLQSPSTCTDTSKSRQQYLLLALSVSVMSKSLKAQMDTTSSPVLYLPRYFSLLSLQFSHLTTKAHFCTSSNTVWTSQAEINSLMNITWHKGNGPMFCALASKTWYQRQQLNCTVPSSSLWRIPSHPEPWGRVA